MAALDKQSGRTVWTTEPLREDRASHSSPLLFRHAGRRIIANCSSAHGFAVDADTGRLLWTVPLRSPYGVNVATPVYGAARVFYTTPYVYGTCYALRPGPTGPEAEKAWSTTLDTCTGTVLLLDGLLDGNGYKKHKSWLCLDWKSGEIRYELKGLTTGAAVYASASCRPRRSSRSMTRHDIAPLNEPTGPRSWWRATASVENPGGNHEDRGPVRRRTT
jgi:outer membrane protein assembly factor BamB